LLPKIEMLILWSLGTFIYNSNGRCSDACRSNYAFAIVQYQNCWCSNLAPGRTEDVGDCNQNCPGFPSEKCGNEQEGLFGYIALDKAPSGTQGGAVPTTRPVSLYRITMSNDEISRPTTRTPIFEARVTAMDVAFTHEQPSRNPKLELLYD
jgi:hypothetical protein